jgi:ribosomal protein S18 acetylase RimI-like enzyme
VLRVRHGGQDKKDQGKASFHGGVRLYSSRCGLVFLRIEWTSEALRGTLAHMEDVLIREAQDNDIGEILRLYREAGIEANRGFTVEEAREQLALFRRYPNFRVFVAEINGHIAGTYELLIMDNLAKRGKKSGVVEDVAVSPTFQGRGIGRAMMLHAREQCKLAGCYKFVLSSGLNRSAAHDFYEAIGFERHGYSFRVEV